jgi:O-acetyl-ADP-ribose deacetylase (regulator of RNase III)
MSAKLVSGNIIDADVDAVVNTVNCVGVMGKGIALQFKQAYPENFTLYQAACKRGDVRPGKMFVFKTSSLTGPRFIINFPTKRHWRGNSRLDDIASGLDDLAKQVHALRIRSIAIPALGCGNGGLNWNDVLPMIREKLEPLGSVDVRVYPPHGAPDPAKQTVGTSRPTLTRVRAALVLLLDKYQVEGYKRTLLEVQKLAYLLQVVGLPLRLTYRKHQFGPYAEMLNPVLQRLEGHYLRGYGDRTQSAEIELVSGAAAAAQELLAQDSEALGAIDKVAELIRGYETPYGMELLATVHWIMAESQLAVVDADVTVRAVRAWNARKMRLFKAEHILKARQRLLDHGLFP